MPNNTSLHIGESCHAINGWRVTFMHINRDERAKTPVRALSREKLFYGKWVMVNKMLVL